jgi:ABC-type branched-subunit amino acid transport system substrate-binding protein
MLVMTQVIMLTCAMPCEVASSTWLLCASVRYGDVAPGAATAAPRAGTPTSVAGSVGKTAGTVAAAAVDACAGAGATATGVTATTIKIGFLLLDVGNLGKFGAGIGGVTPASQQKNHQAFVDQINLDGGLCGRKITPVFRSFDVTDNNQQLSQCAALTEDDKVFAVVSADGLSPTAVSCIVDQHHTFLIIGGDTGIPGSVMARSQGRLFTITAAGPRQMFNWVADLASRQRLNGKTVGLLTLDDPPDVADGSLVPALKQFGVKVADVEKLPANDQGSAASQVPVAVQKMRSAGVDAVFILSGLVSGTAFVQDADNQAWHPSYFVTDWSSEGGNTFVSNMPTDFDGELVTNNDLTIARNGPVSAQEQKCSQVYKDRTGQPLGPRPPTSQDGSYLEGQRLCSADLFILGPGLRGAGGNLTYETLSGAIERLGTVATSYTGGGAYRPGKHDLGDAVMVGRYDGSCKCWVPASGWRQVNQR